MGKVRKKTERFLPKGIDIFSFGRVATLLGISEEDVHKLVELGDLKKGTAEILLREDGTTGRNVPVILDDSYRALAGKVVLAENLVHELLNMCDEEETKPQDDDYYYDEKPGKKGTDPVKIPGYNGEIPDNLVNEETLLRELRRLDYRYADGLNLIRMMPLVGKPDERIAVYSKTQIAQRREKIGVSTLSGIGIGIGLLRAAKMKRSTSGYTVEEVMKKLGLRDTEVNYLRIIDYYENEVFSAKDYGIIPWSMHFLIPDKNEYSEEGVERVAQITDREELKIVRRDIEKICKSFYSADPRHHNVVRDGMPDLPYIDSPIDWRTTDEGIESFIADLVTPGQLAISIFGEDNAYFKSKGDNLDLAAIIAEEAQEKKEGLLASMVIDGQRMWHPIDAPFLKETMEAVGVFEKIKAGINAKAARVTKENGWEKGLGSFYDTHEANGVDYISTSDLIAELGISEGDFGRVSSILRISHPGLALIDETEAAAFDKARFPDEPKEYVRRDYVPRFKKFFLDREAALEFLKPVPCDYETLKAELKRQGIELEGKHTRLNPIQATIDGKSGEFYFKQELAEIKGRIYRKRLVMGIGIGEKKEGAAESGKQRYASRMEAMGRLGINYERLGEFVAAGYLKLGEVGLAPELARIIGREYGLRVTGEDVLEFCMNDERYNDISSILGVTNLGEFIGQTLSEEEAKARIFGKGWLADAVFESQKKELEERYLTIDKVKRVHESDVEWYRRRQRQQLGKKPIREAIAQRLGVTSVARRYNLDAVEEELDTIRERLFAISEKVEGFASNCMGEEVIRDLTGVKFAENGKGSLPELMGAAVPGSMAFLAGKFYADDIESLEKAIVTAAEQLSITQQRAVDFITIGYVGLCREGIPEGDLKRLREKSYAESETRAISATLSERLGSEMFSVNGARCCHRDVVHAYVAENSLSDIKADGMRLLLRSDEWIEHMLGEIGVRGTKRVDLREAAMIGRADKEYVNIEAKIVRYLMRDLGTEPGEDGYSASDFAKLKAYAELLMTGNGGGIHRLHYFKTIDNGGIPTIDSKNCFFTAREVTQIMRRSEDKVNGNGKVDTSELDKAGVAYIGNGVARLYPVKDVAEFAKQQAMERGIEKRIWDFVIDPLDVVLLSLMRAEGVNYSGNTPQRDVKRYSKEFSQTLKIDTQLCESRIRAINAKLMHIVRV